MRKHIGGTFLAILSLCVMMSSLLVSCSGDNPPSCRYGWFGDEALLLLQSGDGRSLAVVSLPAAVVTGYRDHLAAEGRELTFEQTFPVLCGFPATGFFGGTATDLARLRGLLDSLAVETGVSLTQNPTATQRIQALVSYAKPLRKTAMVDTLGTLAGFDGADGLFGELERVASCAGYDAGEFIAIDGTMDWERTQRWLSLWLQQVLDSL